MVYSFSAVGLVITPSTLKSTSTKAFENSASPGGVNVRSYVNELDVGTLATVNAPLNPSSLSRIEKIVPIAGDVAGFVDAHNAVITRKEPAPSCDVTFGAVRVFSDNGGLTAELRRLKFQKSGLQTDVLDGGG